MTLYFNYAELRGYKPGNTSEYRTDADYVIPDEDIDSVDIDEKASEYKDNVKLSIDNYGGKYTGDIDHGDRLEFYVNFEQEAGYGEDGYGEGAYGGGAVHRWTGLVRPYSHEGEGGPAQSMSITAEDFVYAVLGARRAYNVWEDAEIAGHSQAVVNELLQENAPEVDRSALPSISETTDLFAAGSTLLDLIAELALRADRLMVAHGRKLYFKHPQDVTPAFTVNPARDIGPVSAKSNDDTLVNQVRVSGGTDYDLEAANESFDAWTTVTESDRVQYQVRSRKAELARVELYVEPTGSEESIYVRLQKDDGGEPIAPTSTNSDIVREELAADAIAEQVTNGEGWVELPLPEHMLPDANPWILIESSGENGQHVGVNSGDDPLFRAYYPYPVSVRLGSPDSQEAYRLREDRLQDDSLGTFTAARDRALSYLNDHDEPDRTVSLGASSERMHHLQPGDVVRLDLPEYEAVGQYAITSRTDTFEGPTLETTLKATALDSL